jgi:hypothetical protein
VISRRSVLLGIPALVRAQGQVHVGSQTNAWPIDPKNLNSLIEVLATLKRLEFEGFETGFRNLQAYFERSKEARAKLRDSGLPSSGFIYF